MSAQIAPARSVRFCSLARFASATALCLLLTGLPVHAQQARQGAGGGLPLSVVFEPREMAEISAEIPGRILKIHKKLGESFRKGETIFEIDDAMYQANLKKAQAAAHATGAAQDITRKMREYKSASKLDEINAGKEAQTAAANLALAKEELKAAVVKAPFDGFVQKTLVREHQFVEKGEPVIELVDDKVLRVRILMPASAYSSMRIGETVTIAVTETGDTVTGRITQIGHVLDPASSTFDVHGEVDNAAGAVRGGMTGTLLRQ